MASLTCENCGTVNPDNVKFCKQCGNRLPVTTPMSSAEIPSMYSSDQPVAFQMERRYGALRGIAAFLKTLGIILAVLTLAGGAIYFFLLVDDSFFIALVSLIGAVISALLTYLLFLVMSEIISVQLDIEENTRRTAALLEQRLK